MNTLRILLDASRGLPYLYRSLFLEIASRTDTATGVAGIVRRMSYQSLAEELYIEKTQGRSEYGAPDKQALRRGIDYLIKHGYLIKQGPLVFKVPVLALDKSVQNQLDTKLDTKLDTVSATDLPLESDHNHIEVDAISHAYSTVLGHTSDIDIDVINKGSASLKESMDRKGHTPTVFDIAQVFTTHFNFKVHEALTARTKPVYQEWIRRGVTLPLILEVAEEVNKTVQHRGLQRPGSPNYYNSEILRRLSNGKDGGEGQSGSSADPVERWAAAAGQN